MILFLKGSILWKLWHKILEIPILIVKAPVWSWPFLQHQFDSYLYSMTSICIGHSKDRVCPQKKRKHCASNLETPSVLKALVPEHPHSDLLQVSMARFFCLVARHVWHSRSQGWDLGVKPQAMLLTESALAVRIGQYDDTTILTSVIPADTSRARRLWGVGFWISPPTWKI